MNNGKSKHRACGLMTVFNREDKTNGRIKAPDFYKNLFRISCTLSSPSFISLNFKKTLVYFNWNFKILRELDRRENDVKYPIVQVNMQHESFGLSD